MLASLLVRLLPALPKPLLWHVARRYVSGVRREDALATVRALNAEGALATVDLLGEHARDEAEADAAAAEYVELLRDFAREGLRSNVSVKLTHLGLKRDRARCEARLRRICEGARERANFVRVDMEDSSCTSDTLAMLRRVREDFGEVGPAIQAYLRRSLADARALVRDGRPWNVRVCKGIYREPRELAYHDPKIVRRNFVLLVEELARGGAYVGIATHDEAVVYEALRRLETLGVPPDRFEFQMLLGVDEELRRLLLRDGHRLRVYVPYGPAWRAYSLRRLRENPRIATYVARAILPNFTSRRRADEPERRPAPASSGSSPS